MGEKGLLRVVHWGPLLAIGIISVISTFTIICDLQWWPVNTMAGAINIIVFLSWNVSTLYNLFTAMYVGPGHVPLGWKPEKKSHEKLLQYCNQCEGFKAPRSHHCRKCQKCVMKMDHHCPWINNCVGHKNHHSFCYFLFFAPCGCIHALIILIPAMYRAINRNYYIYYGTQNVPLVHLGFRGFIGCMFSVGLAIGVIFAVGGLFIVQLKSVLRNETGIESWINDKAAWREKSEDEEEYVYPYDLGRKKNFTMVFHLKSRPELNGIWWPVKESCHQFTMTVEQIKQKRDKKEKSVLYDIQESFNGAMLPCTKGCRVFCCPPCTDEPRIRVEPGDQVMVSRWKRHWLYGDKVLKDSKDTSTKRVRGWFPRRCAVQYVNGTCEHGDTEESTNAKTAEDKKDD